MHRLKHDSLHAHLRSAKFRLAQRPKLTVTSNVHLSRAKKQQPSEQPTTTLHAPTHTSCYPLTPSNSSPPPPARASAAATPYAHHHHQRALQHDDKVEGLAPRHKRRQRPHEEHGKACQREEPRAVGAIAASLLWRRAHTAIAHSHRPAMLQHTAGRWGRQRPHAAPTCSTHMQHPREAARKQLKGAHRSTRGFRTPHHC